MSHFSVAVFTTENGKPIEELLAPYYEELECNVRIETPRDRFIHENRKYYEEYSDLTGDEFLKKVKDDYQLDSMGNEITTSNPQARWDSWKIGGRWSDFIHLKNGGYANYAQVKYMDLTPDPNRIKKLERYWEVAVEGAEKLEGEDYFIRYTPEYYIRRYKTKENYAHVESTWVTWAVILPDGSWHQKGDMGWFGISDETDEEAIKWVEEYEERFIKSADPDWLRVIVNCHI